MAYNIFERWPFTSFQNLNLDWLLKTTKEAAETAETAATTVQQYNDRLASVENDNIQQDRDIMNIQNVNNQQNQKIDALETDVDAHEQTIRSLQGWDQEQETAINALSSRVTNLENGDNDNVKVTAQDFDETDKNIARNNIGAGTSSVTYDEEMNAIIIEDARTGNLETVPVGGGGGGNPNAVLYVAQTLTEAQKTQARTNIGAGTSNITDAVQYTAQTLTTAQKEQARANIGAGTSNVTDAVQYVQQSLTHEQKIQARENIGAGSTTVLYNPNTNTLIIEENGVTSSYPLPTPIEQIIFGYRDIENNNPVVRKRSDNTVYSAQDMYNDYMNHKLIVVETTSQGLLLINSAEELTVGGASTYIAVFYNHLYHMVVSGSTITELTENVLLPEATSADEGKIVMVGSLGDYRLVTPSSTQGTPKVTMASTDTAPALDANKFYVFPEMASLSISLNTPASNAIVNEFHFRFTSGSTATQFDLPATVIIPDDFDVAANTVYEISIIDNYMVYSCWTVSA